MTEPNADLTSRHSLTFSQAEGLVALPGQLKVGQITQEFRAKLWQYVHHSIQNGIELDDVSLRYEVDSRWRRAVRSHWVDILYRPIDELDTRSAAITKYMRDIIYGASLPELFDTLTFLMRVEGPPEFIDEIVAASFTKARAAYRVVDGRTIVPITSPEEGDAVQKAFADLGDGLSGGGRAHLSMAADSLTKGEWASAIRESMQAVEGIVRQATGEKTFAPALLAFERKWRIPGALKKAFDSLYGYTSAEEGIRHPMIEKQSPDVDEPEAIYMFVCCAAFISYVMSKSRL